MLQKPSTILLLLCSLSFVLALSQNYCSVSDRLSFELYQTLNGIVSHWESAASKYYLIKNNPSKDISQILSLAEACEKTTPVFPQLHYHAPTDSLVYFCASNDVLYILDQSTFEIQTSISLDTGDVNLPVVSLSTDGMSVAVLYMDTLFQELPQHSVLFKVDMQTKTVSTPLIYDKGLKSGEVVVAYAAGKKGAYIATNAWTDYKLKTAVYSIIPVGKTFQLLQLQAGSTAGNTRVVTKLSVFENYIAYNSNYNVFIINYLGILFKNTIVETKPITDGSKGLQAPSFTSQFDGNSLYIHYNSTAVQKISSVDNILTEEYINSDGSFDDVQIALGNSTSGDLMFAFDSKKSRFTIIDLETSSVIETVNCQASFLPLSF